MWRSVAERDEEGRGEGGGSGRAGMQLGGTGVTKESHVEAMFFVRSLCSIIENKTYVLERGRHITLSKTGPIRI